MFAVFNRGHSDHRRSAWPISYLLHNKTTLLTICNILGINDANINERADSVHRCYNIIITTTIIIIRTSCCGVYQMVSR